MALLEGKIDHLIQIFNYYDHYIQSMVETEELKQSVPFLDPSFKIDEKKSLNGLVHKTNCIW